MEFKSERQRPAEAKRQSERLRPSSQNILSRLATPRAKENDKSQNGAGQSAGERRILNSWKEIASYLGRGVRTVQRYERQLNLPVRRPAGKDRSAVLAFSHEVDEWLNRAPMKEHRHVRCVLLMLDPPIAGSLSGRKLVLEVEKFNVLTAFNAEEMFETAEKFDVDGYVIDCHTGDSEAAEICESLKERHPRTPIFAITPESASEGQAPKCTDYVIASSDPQKLLAAVLAVFGSPRLE